MATIKALINGEYIDLPLYSTAYYGGEYPDLNFSIVGNTTQPAAPTENMIWVNTDTEISDYAFSATEPENPVADMVWIEIGDSSAAAFNIDKNNVIMLYPRLVKQYISGAWVVKEAEAFVNGAWKEIIKSVVLYSPGNTYDDITGGYQTYFRGGSSKIEFKEDCIYIHAAWQNEAAVYTQNTFDLSDYGKLYVRCGEQISVGITDPSTEETVTLGTGTENGVNFDISAYNGAYQIRFFGNSTGNYTLTGNVYEARLDV